jgi:myosin heavy subunit
MKDIRSLLLVLLSFGLVATWVYHLYDKSIYSLQKKEINNQDSSVAADSVRDSLQKVYSATIRNLDLRLDSTRNTSDSLQARLTIKVNEVRKLRTEITNILKNPNSTSSELLLARQKMKELEEIMKELRSGKNDLEMEKKELNARLNQMSGEVDNLQQNIRHLNDENKSFTEKIKLASVFVASSLHFTTMHTRSEKEQETSQAKRADKFVASFVLQNNFTEYPNAEIMIVITEPDGNILQSSAWDSGSFDTKTEGRKNYTRKMKFDYSKGEQKALIFTLNIDAFEKGIYTLQIWHDGIKIGEIAKALT